MAVYHETYSFLHPQRKKFQECKEFTWSEREEKINDKFVRLRLDEMKEHQPYFFESNTIHLIGRGHDKISEPNQKNKNLCNFGCDAEGSGPSHAWRLQRRPGIRKIVLILVVEIYCRQSRSVHIK